MNRRSFLTASGLAPAETKQPPLDGKSLIQKELDEREGSLKGRIEPLALPRRTTAGLEPWVPSPQEPWDRQRAIYLLRRTLFGAKKEEIDLALTKSPGEVVDMLLDESKPLPPPPGSWVNQNYSYDPNPAGDLINNTYFSEMRRWWMDLIINQDFSIREKMVAFWHDHWATEYTVVRQPHYNYWFINIFRENFLGNFKEMVKKVAVTPAMLVYLDGQYSTKSRPNENYAREQMELHTLGEGQGYTEDDIRQASRALTGWTQQRLGQLPNGQYEYHPKDAIFIPARYDDTEKTFMGQTGQWNYEDIVNIIFREREEIAAKFICRKLYREFVYEIADETIIEGLANILIANNWVIKPVMETLLKSAHFFDKMNIGAHITSPLEAYVGAIRTLEIPLTSTNVLMDVFNTCSLQGLQILEAPNVKGWPGYRAWVSASRLATRWNSTDLLIDDSKKPVGSRKFNFDPVAFITKISDPNDAKKINQAVIDLLFDIKLNTYQTEVLLNKFLTGWKDYEWDINNPGARDRLYTLFKAALRNNEYQLT